MSKFFDGGDIRLSNVVLRSGRWGLRWEGPDEYAITRNAMLEGLVFHCIRAKTLPQIGILSCGMEIYLSIIDPSMSARYFLFCVHVLEISVPEPG